MNEKNVTRRDALKSGAVGVAAMSAIPAGVRTPQDAKPAPAAAPAATGTYVARDYSGLVGTPGFSKALLEDHFTLYQGYVKQTNGLIATLAEHAKAGTLGTPAASELRRRFGWEFNGMRLHELYFENLGPKALEKDSRVAKLITDSFGSIEAWEKDFRTAAAMRGIGWVALMHDAWAKRVYNVWINEHDVGVLGACPILLIMDVFEHAFIRDYGIKRADYIEAFMKAVNWGAVELRAS